MQMLPRHTGLFTRSKLAFALAFNCELDIILYGIHTNTDGLNTVT